MGLIMTDPVQWVCEHCATKEDILYHINKLQEVYDAWVDDNEEEEDLFKYQIYISCKYSTNLYVKAHSNDSARDIANNYLNSISISDPKFTRIDGEIAIYPKNFDDSLIDIVEGRNHK